MKEGVLSQRCAINQAFENFFFCLEKEFWIDPEILNKQEEY